MNWDVAEFSSMPNIF